MRRRGRPKGSGINDDAKLQAISERIAETGVRPTTAIKQLGWTNEADIRRLRDKLKSFTPKSREDVLAASVRAEKASAPASPPRMSAAALATAAEPTKSATPRQELRSRLDKHTRALAALDVPQTADIEDTSEFAVAALTSAIATANFLAVQQAVFLAASMRTPLMTPWAHAAGRAVCACCGLETPVNVTKH
ncbi:MAG: hypothetical protein AAFV26_06345 [Pseudomonadota bacterium]